MEESYRIYLDEKFSKLHEEVHDIAVTVAEIVQWKKDMDMNDADTIDKRIRNRDKVFGLIGSIAAIVSVYIVVMNVG